MIYGCCCAVAECTVLTCYVHNTVAMNDDRRAGGELLYPIQLYVLQTTSLCSDGLLIYIQCCVSQFQVTSKQF